MKRGAGTAGASEGKDGARGHVPLTVLGRCGACARGCVARCARSGGAWPSCATADKALLRSTSCPRVHSLELDGRMRVSQIGGSSGISATAGMIPDRGGVASHPMAGGLLCLGAPAPCRTADSPATIFLRTARATLASGGGAGTAAPAAPRAATVGRGRPGWSGFFRGQVRVTDVSRFEKSAVSTTVLFSREDKADPDVCRKETSRMGWSTEGRLGCQDLSPKAKMGWGP